MGQLIFNDKSGKSRIIIREKKKDKIIRYLSYFLNLISISYIAYQWYINN